MPFEEPLTRKPLRFDMKPAKMKNDNDDKTVDESIEKVHMNECYEDHSTDEYIKDEESSPSKKRNQLNHNKLYPMLHVENDSCSENTTNKKTPPVSTNEGSKVNIYNAILSIVVCGLCVFIYIFFLPSNAKQSSPDAAKDIVMILKSDFSLQASLSLKIIKTSLEKVINSEANEPAHPSILLLLISKHDKGVGSCFAVKLARLISKSANNFLEINGEIFKYKEANKAKEEIDANITKAFDIDGQIVVLLNHLDMVPSPAAMMLHSYCDHENAPFKKVVFIMTISAEEEISQNADSKYLDSLANSRLTNVWSNLHKDQLSALLSRITVSVAAILAGNTPSYCNFLQQ